MRVYRAVMIRAVAGVFALALVAAGGPAAAAPLPVKPAPVFAAHLGSDAQVSSNWAGYAVTGTGAGGTPTAFTDVTGRWVQPSVTCTPGRSAYSAFWVGLGGFSDGSQALEQIGTESNCDSQGRAVYAAWYEIVPAPSIPIRMRIAPGDRLVAAVLVQGTQVTLQLTNATRHVRVTKRVTVPQPDLTSAEWIAEAPSTCSSSGRCTPLSLANFGSVSFARSAATGDGHAGTISEPAWTTTSIELVQQPGELHVSGRDGSGATPGALSADGREFAVTSQTVSR